MCRLGSGPNVVGRLGLGIWVSGSFQIFAVTAAGEMYWVGREIVRRNMSEGENVRE